MKAFALASRRLAEILMSRSSTSRSSTSSRHFPAIYTRTEHP